jgi:nucleoside-diphosphate-sugar epimerase
VISINIFIIGIAGGTGSRVATLLAKQGDTVSGLYRRPEQIAALHEVGASGVLGDVATISEQELASAASADVLVFTAGAGDQDNDSMIDAVDGDGVRKAIAAQCGAANLADQFGFRAHAFLCDFRV